MCAHKQKHFISSLCCFNEFQNSTKKKKRKRLDGSLETIFTTPAPLIHLASGVSKPLSLPACKCLAVHSRHFFLCSPQFESRCIFHSSLLSGNLYFSHCTPTLPLDLSCQVSESVLHKVTAPPVTNHSSFTLVPSFLRSSWVTVCCCGPTSTSLLCSSIPLRFLCPHYSCTALSLISDPFTTPHLICKAKKNLMN